MSVPSRTFVASTVAGTAPSRVSESIVAVPAVVVVMPPTIVVSLPMIVPPEYELTPDSVTPRPMSRSAPVPEIGPLIPSVAPVVLITPPEPPRVMPR